MINFVIFGGGRICLSHLPHILSNKNVTELTVVEPNFFNRIFLRIFFNVKCVKSIENINLACFDAGCILTPPLLHKFYADLCINHNIPFFVEKPTTLSFNDTQSIINQSNYNNLYCQSGYVYRYHPIFVKLKELILDHSSKIESMKFKLNANVHNINSVDTWRNSSFKGSGCLYDFGSHIFDLSLFLLEKSDLSINHLKTEKESVFRKSCVDIFSSEFLIDDIYTFFYCNWSNDEVRKTTIEVRVDFPDCYYLVDLFSIKKYIADEIVSYINVNELFTDVNYYLRGEDFSNQWSHFFKHMYDDVSSINANVDYMLDLAHEA